MHRQKLNMKDDIVMVENDPDNESWLNLTINRKPITDWFKEEWHRLRYGIRLPQQEKKKQRIQTLIEQNIIEANRNSKVIILQIGIQ